MMDVFKERLVYQVGFSFQSENDDLANYIFHNNCNRDNIDSIKFIDSLTLHCVMIITLIYIMSSTCC